MVFGYGEGPFAPVAIREAEGDVIRKAIILEEEPEILATGGLSYPSTGSTGDGYTFAERFGHTVTPLSPGLVGMTAKESYIRQLQGLSLRNVRVKIFLLGKSLLEEIRY